MGARGKAGHWKSSIPRIDLPRIPMLDQFHNLIMVGIKTMTTRPSRYGPIGARFKIVRTDPVMPPIVIEIIKVFKLELGCVAKEFWKEEGASSEENFKDIWCRLHSRTKFREDKLVWVHRFRKLTPKEIKEYEKD